MGDTLVGISYSSLTPWEAPWCVYTLFFHPMGGTLVGIYHILTHGRHPGGYIPLFYT